MALDSSLTIQYNEVKNMRKQNQSEKNWMIAYEKQLLALPK
jgi:hypothetical protein